MNIKTVAGSLVCCIALGANEASALESVNSINIAVSNKKVEKDERCVTIDISVKKGKNDISMELVRLKSGSIVEVVEEEGDWAKVKIKEDLGYIKLENLKRLNTQVIERYLEGIEYLDVYSNMSGQESAKIGKIYCDNKIQILEELGPYIRIQWKDGEAYIENKKDYIVKERKKVIKTNTTVRSKLDSDSMYKKIQKGTVVTIEEVLADYYKVSYKDEYGYIKKNDLIDLKYVGKKNLRAINLYVSGNDSSDIRTYIPSGAEVEVISYYGEYAYVKYGEYVGYIKCDNLTSKELILVNERKEAYLSKRVVNRNEVEEAYNRILLDKEDFDKEFKKLINRYGLKKIEDTKEIKITKNRGKYLEVKVDDSEYYMDNEGVYKDDKESELTYIHTEPSVDTKANTRYIAKMDAKVYLDKEKETMLGLLSKDTQVEIVEEIDDEVSKVKINGSCMFVESSDLSTEKMYTKVKGVVKNVDTNKSHKAYVESQSNKLNINLDFNGAADATMEQLAYYSNPNKVSISKKEQRYQYLKLDTFRMIDANKLNKFLNGIYTGGKYKNIFENKADVFISSAKRYNIDPVYLVAHTLLETGKGKSRLAQGLPYKDKGIVYNFFGIGAVDSDPIEGGKTLAYKNGWTTIDKTIEGSAKWLANNYIHLNTNRQNTLYKMRFNYMTRTHQYASDIKWASKISSYMNKLSYLYIDTNLEFEVPLYKKWSYATGKISNGNKENVSEKPVEESKPSNKKPSIEEKPSVEEDKPSNSKPATDEKPPVEENKPEEEKPSVEDSKPEEEKPSVEDSKPEEEVKKVD